MAVVAFDDDQITVVGTPEYMSPEQAQLNQLDEAVGDTSKAKSSKKAATDRSSWMLAATD